MLRVTVAVVASLPAPLLTVLLARVSVKPAARLVDWAATTVLTGGVVLIDLAKSVLNDNEPVSSHRQAGNLHGHRPRDRLIHAESAGKRLGGQQGRVVAGRIGRQKHLLRPGPGRGGRAGVGERPADGRLLARVGAGECGDAAGNQLGIGAERRRFGQRVCVVGLARRRRDVLVVIGRDGELDLADARAAVGEAEVDIPASPMRPRPGCRGSPHCRGRRRSPERRRSSCW